MTEHGTDWSTVRQAKPSTTRKLRKSMHQMSQRKAVQVLKMVVMEAMAHLLLRSSLMLQEESSMIILVTDAGSMSSSITAFRLIDSKEEI
jgi:leucyl aminopeptidase (aminopeptidase T)